MRASSCIRTMASWRTASPPGAAATASRGRSATDGSQDDHGAFQKRFPITSSRASPPASRAVALTSCGSPSGGEKADERDGVVENETERLRGLRDLALHAPPLRHVGVDPDHPHRGYLPIGHRGSGQFRTTCRRPSEGSAHVGMNVPEKELGRGGQVRIETERLAELRRPDRVARGLVEVSGQLQTVLALAESGPSVPGPTGPRRS